MGPSLLEVLSARSSFIVSLKMLIYSAVWSSLQSISPTLSTGFGGVTITTGYVGVNGLVSVFKSGMNTGAFALN